MSRRRRLAMVNRGHPGLSVVKQCRLLQLSRSAVYYRPTPTNPADLDLMAGMDRQYLKTPFYGSRRMTAWLRTQGHQVNRKRVRRLMRAMGLEAIYRKPNTSKPAPEHRIYPYLLKGVAVRQGQSGLGSRHHLPAHVPGIPLSRGHYGLAQPVRAGLEALQYSGGGLVYRGPERSLEQRTAGDLQHRLG